MNKSPREGERGSPEGKTLVYFEYDSSTGQSTVGRHPAEVVVQLEDGTRVSLEEYMRSCDPAVTSYVDDESDLVDCHPAGSTMSFTFDTDDHLAALGDIEDSTKKQAADAELASLRPWYLTLSPEEKRSVRQRFQSLVDAANALAGWHMSVTVHSSWSQYDGEGNPILQVDLTKAPHMILEAIREIDGAASAETESNTPLIAPRRPDPPCSGEA